MRYEHGAVQQREQVMSDPAETGRGGNIVVVEPVYRGRFDRNRTRWSNEPREPGCLDTVCVEPYDGKRDDLVPTGRCPGRLAIEHRVSDRRRHVGPPSQTPWDATDTDRH